MVTTTPPTGTPAEPGRLVVEVSSVVVKVDPAELVVVMTMPATASVPGVTPVIVWVALCPEESVPVLTTIVLVPITDVAVTVATEPEPEI